MIRNRNKKNEKIIYLLSLSLLLSSIPYSGYYWWRWCGGCVVNAEAEAVEESLPCLTLCYSIHLSWEWMG